MVVVRCIGCGCTDTHACAGENGPCHWLDVDEAANLGVCSECAVHLSRWHSGDRSITTLMLVAKIVDEKGGEPFYIERNDMGSFPYHLGDKVGSKYSIEWVSMAISDFEALPQFKHFQLAQRWQECMKTLQVASAHIGKATATSLREEAAAIEKQIQVMGYDLQVLLDLV